MGRAALAALIATTSATLAAALSPDSTAKPPRLARTFELTLASSSLPAARRHLTLLCDSRSPLVGIVAVHLATKTPSTPSLYITHNFSSYAPVSMPNPVNHPVIWGSCTVDFTTPSVGWATRSIPGGGSFLYKTTDGGREWSLVRVLGHGGNSPWAWAEFANRTDGWLAAGDIGSNGGELFQRTQDGGRTWRTLPTVYTLGEPEFLNATRGFASGIPLKETTNGGMTWTTQNVPVHATGTPIVDSSLVSGSTGVLLVFVARTQPSVLTQNEQVPVSIAFDTTSAGGRSWSPGPTVRATALTGLDGVHGTGGAVSGGSSAAAAVSPSDWWLITLERTGRFKVEVTTDAGSGWSTRSGTGLPAIDVPGYLTRGIATPIHLTALTPRIAFATITTTPTTPITYVTTDGGAQWSPLTSLTL